MASARMNANPPPRRHMKYLLAILLTATRLCADGPDPVFYLVGANGTRQGPFTFADQSKLTLQGRAYTLVVEPAKVGPALAKLQSMQVEDLRFQDAPLPEVLRVLTEISMELDVKGKTGVTFHFMDPTAKARDPLDPFLQDTSPALTWSCRNLDLLTCLKQICMLTGCTYSEEHGMVVVRPKPKAVGK